MLWIVVHEPFWLEIHFPSEIWHRTSSLICDTGGQCIILSRLICDASTPRVPVLAPGYLAVFAGPPDVKNQRATQNGVDKKHGSDDGNGRCQFHPGRAEGVATSQERSTKVMLLGKRMGKFSILRAKTFW